MDTTEIDNILNLIEEECTAARRFWGEDFNSLNTANDWAAFICRYATTAIIMDRETKIFNKKQFESNLIKAAGCCVSAILQMRDGKLAKRHYDVEGE